MKQNQHISVDAVQAVIDQLYTLREGMTFVVPLTDSERQEQYSARLGPAKLRTVENRLAAAREHRDLLPPAFEFKKFERDAGAAIALAKCINVLEEILEDVNDTYLAVGHRAVIAAAQAYDYIRVTSRTAERLKRTVEKLKTRVPTTATGLAPVAEPTVIEPVPVSSEPTDKAA